MLAPRALVFDLYGTLFDVHSVAAQCERLYPKRGAEFSAIWRQKQLEYTWLRSLMGQYIPFEQATREALAYTCNHLALDCPDSARDTLSEAYLRLAPYPEVAVVLDALRAHGLPLAILSNGSQFSIGRVLGNSGLESRFAHLLSVDAAGVFKPHPRVYELACAALSLDAADILFVSSNPWDVSGAWHFGFRVCWINRGNTSFDELGATPDLVLDGLAALPDSIVTS